MRLSKDVIVKEGFRYRIEIYRTGEALLWFDVYRPAYSESLKKKLSVYELRSEGLIYAHRRFAVLSPQHRLEQTRRILDRLVDDNAKIRIDFADGDRVIFSSELVEVNSSQ
ncbi:MAG: hypothetical protein QXU11_06305 [Thermoproteota archaeon]